MGTCYCYKQTANWPSFESKSIKFFASDKVERFDSRSCSIVAIAVNDVEFLLLLLTFIFHSNFNRINFPFLLCIHSSWDPSELFDEEEKINFLGNIDDESSKRILTNFLLVASCFRVSIYHENFNIEILSLLHVKLDSKAHTEIENRILNIHKQDPFWLDFLSVVQYEHARIFPTLFYFSFIFHWSRIISCLVEYAHVSLM